MRRLEAALRDPVYANGLALVANALVNAGLGFAFWMAAARLLEPGALGFGAAIVSAATLAALLGKTGLDAAIVRFVPGAYPRLARKILLYAMATTLLATGVVAALIILATWGPAGSLAPLREPVAALGFVTLACAISATWVLDAYFLAEQRTLVSLGRNLAFQIVKLSLLFVAVGTLAGFAVPLVWGAGVFASFAVAFAFVPSCLAKRASRGAPRPSRAEVARYAASNYSLNLAEFAPGLVLPVLVLETMGSEANAGFFLAWTVVNVGFLISKAVAQSAFAQLVRDASPRPALAKAAKLSVLALVPFVLLLVAGADLILGVFGATYGGSAAALRLFALSVVPIAFANHFLAYLKAREAGPELTLLPLSTLGALALALPAGLYVGGIEGLAAGWLAVQLVVGAYALARLFATLRRTPHAQGPHLGRRPHQG